MKRKIEESPVELIVQNQKDEELLSKNDENYEKKPKVLENLSEEGKKFEQFLIVKGLSEGTKASYLIYFNILEQIKLGLGQDFELNQDFVNTFLSSYTCGVARAFMKNYLMFVNRKDLEVIKRTGRTEKKKKILIPEEHMQMLDNYFINAIGRSPKKQDNLRNWLLFNLSRYGALRREEVVNIRMCDLVNIDEVRKDPNKPVKLLIRKAKGNKQRYVILPRDVVVILTHFAQNFGKYEKIFKISKVQWWKIFKKACISLGFTKIIKNKQGKEIVSALYHPHSIRHTQSSNWWEEGVDIIDIQTRLGHANISTTRLYITPDENKQLRRWEKELEGKKVL